MCEAHIKVSFTWKLICLLDLFLFSFLQLNELNEKILGPHHICILFKMRFPFWFDKNPRFLASLMLSQFAVLQYFVCWLWDVLQIQLTGIFSLFVPSVIFAVFLLWQIPVILSTVKDAVSGCSKNILTGEVSRGSWIKIYVSLIQIQAGAWNFICE